MEPPPQFLRDGCALAIGTKQTNGDVAHCTWLMESTLTTATLQQTTHTALVTSTDNRELMLKD